MFTLFLFFLCTIATGLFIMLACITIDFFKAKILRPDKSVKSTAVARTAE